MTNEKPFKDVIYMTPKGPVAMTLFNMDVQTLCETAQQLGATHWLCQDGYDTELQMPIFALFERKRCNPDGGGLRRWSLGEPTKTWTVPSIDGPWMWAMHKGGMREG